MVNETLFVTYVWTIRGKTICDGFLDSSGATYSTPYSRSRSSQSFWPFNEGVAVCVQGHRFSICFLYEGVLLR